MAGRSVADAATIVDALVRDHQSAPIGPADRVMLDYAVKLTREPSRVSANDAAALRAAGFDDRAIHDICAVTAYYAFVNRMADGLGVELEERFDQ